MGTWYAAGSPSSARWIGVALGSDRVYDPFENVIGNFSSTTFTWAAATGTLPSYAGNRGYRPSGNHTPPAELGATRFTRLLDGRIYACGGITSAGARVANSVFGTVSGNSISWVNGNDIYAARAYHILCTLSDGRLLAFNGGYPSNPVEIYLGTVSGDTVTWVAATPPSGEETAWANLFAIAGGREKINPSVLSSGKVLLINGTIPTNGVVAYWLITVTGDACSVSQYSTTFASPPPAQVGSASWVLMADGSVLHGGGGLAGNLNSNKWWRGTFSGTALSFVPSENSLEANNTYTSLRHSLVSLSDGRVGVSTFLSGVETSLGDSYYVAAGLSIPYGQLNSSGSAAAVFVGDSSTAIFSGSFSMAGSSAVSFGSLVGFSIGEFSSVASSVLSGVARVIRRTAFHIEATSEMKAAAAYAPVRFSVRGVAKAVFLSPPRGPSLDANGSSSAVFRSAPKSVATGVFATAGQTAAEFSSLFVLPARLSSIGVSQTDFNATYRQRSDARCVAGSAAVFSGRCVYRARFDMRGIADARFRSVLRDDAQAVFVRENPINVMVRSRDQ